MMLRFTLTFCIALLSLSASATQLVPQEGVAGVPWHSSRAIFKDTLTSRSVDVCAEGDAVLAGIYGQNTYRKNYAQVGLDCIVEQLPIKIGKELFELEANFDTSDRLVKAVTRGKYFNSAQTSAEACRDAHSALAAAFGEGKTTAYAFPDTGGVQSSTNWKTRATIVKLSCGSSSLKNKGHIDIELTFALWHAAKNR
jgi:hypothetical protein